MTVCAASIHKMTYNLATITIKLLLCFIKQDIGFPDKTYIAKTSCRAAETSLKLSRTLTLELHSLGCSSWRETAAISLAISLLCALFSTYICAFNLWMIICACFHQSVLHRWEQLHPQWPCCSDLNLGGPLENCLCSLKWFIQLAFSFFILLNAASKIFYFDLKHWLHMYFLSLDLCAYMTLENGEESSPDNRVQSETSFPSLLS